MYRTRGNIVWVLSLTVLTNCCIKVPVRINNLASAFGTCFNFIEHSYFSLHIVDGLSLSVRSWCCLSLYNAEEFQASLIHACNSKLTIKCKGLDMFH